MSKEQLEVKGLVGEIKTSGGNILQHEYHRGDLDFPRERCLKLGGENFKGKKKVPSCPHLVSVSEY